MDVDRDPFFMLSLMAPMSAMYAVLALLVIPFVLYVIARWRAHRDSAAGHASDPQLGIKVALGYFAITAFQVVLAGAMLFVYAVLTNMSDERGSLYRAAFGLMMPAGLVFGAHIALLGRTNQEMFPSVRRLFAGFNLMLSGMFGFIGLVLAFEMLLKRGPAGEMGRFAAAMVLVYGGAWGGVGWKFSQLVLGEDGAPSGPAGTIAAPFAPSAIAPSGPALPPLGGGSFPPIER